jgi:hypothetical protein
MASYLLPIADREPLIWILRERKTAFPIYRRRDAEQLATGDRLLLYTEAVAQTIACLDFLYVSDKVTILG